MIPWSTAWILYSTLYNLQSGSFPPLFVVAKKRDYKKFGSIMIKNGNCPSTSTINSKATLKPKEVLNQIRPGKAKKHCSCGITIKKGCSGDGLPEPSAPQCNGTFDNCCCFCSNLDPQEPIFEEQLITADLADNKQAVERYSKKKCDNQHQQQLDAKKSEKQKKTKSDQKTTSKKSSGRGILSAIMRACNSAPDGLGRACSKKKGGNDDHAGAESGEKVTTDSLEVDDYCRKEFRESKDTIDQEETASEVSTHFSFDSRANLIVKKRTTTAVAGRQMEKVNGRPKTVVHHNSTTTLSSTTTSMATDSDSLKSPVSASNSLDHQLMDVTLKNVKYMRGSPKFTVFGDCAFQRDFLEAHNHLRKHHGVPDIVWCQELAKEAAEWAHLVVAKGRILFQEKPDIGENIALIETKSINHLPTGKEIVDLWTKQAEKFRFDNPKWTADCRNFTQLIWKSTLRLGASRIWLQSKNLVAVVAFYTPRGNKNGIGEFTKNILPPKDHHHEHHHHHHQQLGTQDCGGGQDPTNCPRSATVITSDYGSSSDQGLNQITSNMNRNLNLNING